MPVGASVSSGLDLSALNAESPELINDLPLGQTRFKARGYVAPLFAGVVTQRDGTLTGALPGRFARDTKHPSAKNGEEATLAKHILPGNERIIRGIRQSLDGLRYREDLEGASYEILDASGCIAG